MYSKSKIPKSSEIPSSKKSRVSTTNKTATTSSKKSSASSKRTSPEVKTILEAIDELGTDLKQEILDRLIPLKLSEFVSAQKPLTKDILSPSCQPADRFDYVDMVFDENFKKFSTKHLAKEVNEVASIIGDKTIDTLSRNSPINNSLNNMFKNDRKLRCPLEGAPQGIYPRYLGNDEFGFHGNYNSKLKSLKDRYEIEKYKNKGNKYWQQFNKDYIELWNSYNSAPDILPHLQTEIKKYRDLIENYDDSTTEKDRPKIDEFLALNANNTYSEYIKAIRNLPISVKKIIYYPTEEEQKELGYKSKGKWSERERVY